MPLLSKASNAIPSVVQIGMTATPALQHRLESTALVSRIMTSNLLMVFKAQKTHLIFIGRYNMHTCFLATI